MLIMYIDLARNAKLADEQNISQVHAYTPLAKTSVQTAAAQSKFNVVMPTAAPGRRKP